VPLGSDELRGRVVLVGFWTFTCINWMRTAPYLRAWDAAYRRDGLLIVGAHTPEFSFEHDLDAVRREVDRRGIHYPVVVDNDYEIWRSFDNHYWPALYVLDQQGTLRHHHFGEGNYEKSEHVLQRLLGVDRALISVTPRGDELEADWVNLRSRDTYLGYGRGSGFVPNLGEVLDESSSYEVPAEQPVNTWSLDGHWTFGDDQVVLDLAGGSIAFRYHARDVHLVMTPGAGTPITFTVRLDGEPPGRSHGADIDGGGNGVLRHARMYQLIRAQDVSQDRVLTVTFDEPGAQLYVFTFG
jgi:hypothetical protein